MEIDFVPQKKILPLLEVRGVSVTSVAISVVGVAITKKKYFGISRTAMITAIKETNR